MTVEIRKTICSICNPISHCGVDAHVENGLVVKVEGTKENPHSEGTLCAKGASGRQYVYHPDRLLTPLLRRGERGQGLFEPISWDDALGIVTEKFLKIKAQFGPEALIFYVGYPKWMRPYVQRLAHGFGSPNFCTESSCCATAVKAAAVLDYGSFYVPDIAHTSCLVAWSSNPFYSNTSTVRRLVMAKERGMRVIEVGPLITPLTKYADVHLRIRPGTSGALALGMARVMISENLYDREFVSQWSHGFEAFSEYVKEFTPEKTEAITGVPSDLVLKGARLYALSKPAALLSGMSPTTHHTNGLQNQRAISALIGLTGNFDVKGGNYCLPPAYLNQPNGLITREAAFTMIRGYEDMPTRVGQDRFPVWCDLISQAQAMALPDQILSESPYPLRGMIGFGFNHHMWPAPDHLIQAMQKLDFITQVELFMTDTTRWCDLVLPACTSFERHELKVYPYPTRYMIWTQPAIEPLGQSRSDVDIVCDLAKGLTPEDPLLTKGHEACLDWILEPTGYTVAKLSEHPNGLPLEDISYPPYRKYQKNGFKTPSGKMEFASLVLEKAGYDPLPTYKEPEIGPISRPDLAKDYPLILTTGARKPTLVHSRTYRLGWLNALEPDAVLDMNPVDGRERRIVQGDKAELATERGRIKVKVNLTEVVAPGVVSIYHGHPEADVNYLFAPDYLDPISGFPGFKSALCNVTRVG